MCCLKFEHDPYIQEIKKTPPVDATVKTSEGVGVVVEINPLSGFIKVKVDETIRIYHRDDVKIISMPKKKAQSQNDELEDIEE